MTKTFDVQLHIKHGERLLNLLEEALRRSGRLPPITTEQLSSERTDAPQPGSMQNTPHWFDDPFAVIKKGRELIEKPPELTASDVQSAAARNALALAARNGKPISPEIRKLMDADRQKSEAR